MPSSINKYAKKPMAKKSPVQRFQTRNPQSKGGKTRNFNRELSIFRAGQAYGIPEAPFPARLWTKCTFAQPNVLSSSVASVAGGRSYRLNSIYDPDFQLGGRTVLGWDRLNSMYDRYVVHKATIYVTFSNPAFAGTLVGVRLRVGTNFPANGNSRQELLERPMTYLKVISPDDKATAFFKMEINPWELAGQNRTEYLDQADAAMNANPTQVSYADIFVLHNQEAPVVDCDVKIVYDTMLYNRKEQFSTVIA